ncbi:MAG: GDSL-type esterase/lipase family protein [Candidatus Paceibacterota bacterium]
MKRACVFGASITSGKNDFKEGGWCDLLKRYLFGKGIFVYNLGVSGDDTNDLLKRFDNECEARRPDIIIFAIGGNDTQYFINEKQFRVDIEDTIENFRELLDKAKDYTSHVIVIGLTRVDEEVINSVYIEEKGKCYKNKFLEKYDKSIEKVSSEQDVHFIPTFDVIDKSDLDDGLHPTPKGHKKLFVRIRNYIDNLDLY